MPFANWLHIHIISFERPPDFVITPNEPGLLSFERIRFSYEPPTTPSRHFPAEIIPIDDGPLNILPSFFASLVSILESFSATPSVIMETTLILSHLKASRTLASALFGA